MRTLVYYVIPQNRLASTPQGGTFAFPKMPSGRGYGMSLRFLDIIDGAFVEVQRGVRSGNISVGWIDERPQAGDTRLCIDNELPVAGVNLTAVLDRNEGGQSFQSKLNALTGRPSDFRVDKIDGGWLIRRVDGGAIAALELVENNLWPFCVGEVTGYQEDGKWHYELRLQVAPLAITDEIGREDPPSPRIIRMQAGFTMAGGVSRTNEVQKLIIPQNFRAAYSIRDSRTQVKTSLLTLATAGEAEIQEALQAIMRAGETATVADVTTTGDIEVRIEYGGELAGLPVDLFEVVIAPDAPPGDVTFVIPFDQPALFASLRKQKTIESVPIEITLDLVPTPADEANLDVPAERFKTAGHTVTLVRSLVSPALATSFPPSLLNSQPKSTRYLPFNDTMVGVGQMPYVIALGDGATTHFVEAHNLNSQVLTGYVAIDRATKLVLTPGKIADGADYEIRATSLNTVTLDFAVAPAALGANSGVTFALATPQSLQMFLAGLLVEMANVNGLEDLISELLGRVTELEEILPTTGVGAASVAGRAAKWQVPSRAWIYPKPTDAKVRAILSELKVPDVAEADFPMVDESLLPSPGFLLPAIHDALTDDLVYAGALPDPADVVESVFVVDGADVPMLPRTGLQTRGSGVPVGELLASDGNVLYAVRQQAGKKTYNARSFELPLFSPIPVNEVQFRVGALFTLDFTIALQLLRANTEASYLLTIETCPFSSLEGGDPAFGANLSKLDWDALGKTALAVPLKLSGTLASHRFGMRVKRAAGGISADVITYATATGVPDGAPETPSFAVRAMLSQFDVADIPKPAGFVLAMLSGVRADITA